MRAWVFGLLRSSRSKGLTVDHHASFTFAAMLRSTGTRPGGRQQWISPTVKKILVVSDCGGRYAADCLDHIFDPGCARLLLANNRQFETGSVRDGRARYESSLMFLGYSPIGYKLLSGLLAFWRNSRRAVCAARRNHNRAKGPGTPSRWRLRVAVGGRGPC